MFHPGAFLAAIGAFLLLLVPLVLIHEFGHYAMARAFRVRAEVFSIGFGRALWGRTDRRGTFWKIGWIPVGGYVQFAGDANAASMPAASDAKPQPGTLAAAKLWQRALIVAAGPLANLLTAQVIFTVFNFAYGLPTAPPVIGGFAANSPAQAAGLAIGDTIVAIDGASISQFEDIPERVQFYPGRTVTVVYRHHGEVRTVPVRLALRVEHDRFGNELRRGLLGIASHGVHLEQVGPVGAVRAAFGQCTGVVRMMVVGMSQIASGERSTREMGGPVKIAQYSGQAIAMGWLSFVTFAALISINLGFINLLPIPVLDGGHLALYAAEAIRRRPLGPRETEWAFRTGLALVLALVLFVTFNDLSGLLPHGK